MYRSTPASFVFGRLSALTFTVLFAYSVFWLILQFAAMQQSLHRVNSPRVDNFNPANQVGSIVTAYPVASAVNYAVSTKQATGDVMADYYPDH